MINLALIQHSFKGSKQATIDFTLEKIAESAKNGANLVALQELHTSEYFCQREDVEFFTYAESFEREKRIFADSAKKHKIVLVTSLFEKRAKGLYHNTAVVFEKDGSIAGQYRKMHIPDDPSFYEKFYFTPGDNDFKPIATSLGKIGVLICWDQWFPEAARLMALSGAEIIIYPTAIGWDLNDSQDEKQRQLEAWKAVQRGHAVANGVFVCAVNRWGVEGNSVLGMQFRTCGNFRTSTDLSLVESPKISANTKATPQSLRLRFCESQNLSKNQAESAESTTFCHSERSEESKKSPFVILRTGEISQKKNNRDSSVATLPQNDNLGLDSANQNNPSLRADSQNLRGNPPYENTQNLQCGLPRSHSLARNDNFLDSSLRLRSAQNDKIETENDKNCVRVAESSLDSADFPSDSAFFKQKANSSIVDEFSRSCEVSDENKINQPTNSSISDGKSGLRSHERGDRTDEFIDEASGKSPRFIAERRIWAESKIHFWGNSFVFGPQGEPLALASEDKDEILQVKIDLRRISQVRNIWPFLRDRRIDFYGNLTKRFID